MFDGTNFGITDYHMSVKKFEGVRRIASLDVYPLGYHSNPSLGSEYSLRGQKILDVQDMHYCNYNGPTTKAIHYGLGATKHVS